MAIPVWRSSSISHVLHRLHPSLPSNPYSFQLKPKKISLYCLPSTTTPNSLCTPLPLNQHLGYFHVSTFGPHVAALERDQSTCLRTSKNAQLRKFVDKAEVAKSPNHSLQIRVQIGPRDFSKQWNNRVDLFCHGHRSEVSFSIGTHLIPHPNKVDKGGEDAFFVSSYNGGVLAIADGVSGWAERDVDPALFSQELMSNASYLVEDEKVDYDPQILLRKAHAATSSIGSATVIVAMLEKNGTLKIANVGDCGLRVLRKGQVVFSTSPQEHSFDCPYQLSSEVVGQTYQDAMALAELASNHSKDINFDSPYSLEARSRGFDVPLWKKVVGMKLTGGKLDDITVIVGHVVST
ncbi:probable protein phosphatase 2C 26 isoform X2 [Magnolia sinica]|uniref:probable protein phosphatase 2C 26 isoform X2 n=1 Tax=Magnolia sinica TaxID=86752 RepID=UPI00265A2530|nr:probable protein phosphatase 2C 26 isoform X2 [Magnolia sinica]